MNGIKDAVLKAICEYNKYHSPEARAKLVEINEKCFIVDFEGVFCSSCGVYDYFEDLIYELKNFTDEDVEILSFRKYEPEKIRVEYKFKKNKSVNGENLKE